MANPVWQSVAVASGFGATRAHTLPSGVQAGDLLVANVTVSQASVSSVPSGWTHVRTDEVFNNRHGSYWRIATGSDAGTWGFSASTDHVVRVSRYTGHDPDSPIAAHSGATSGGSSTVTAPSITPSVADTLLAFSTAVYTTPTAGTPSGMTSRWNDTPRSMRHLGATQNHGSGATGTRSSGLGSNATWAVSLVAIAPLANQPPGAPTLLTPADTATIDPSQPTTFTWTHNDPDSDPQAAYSLRRLKMDT